MRSKLPKVMHVLCGQPMLEHVMQTARELKPAKIHVVVSPQTPEVKQLATKFGASAVTQPQPTGTGGAAQVAMNKIPNNAVVLILFGDLPLVSGTALKELVTAARKGKLALRTMQVTPPTGYSRVLRDDQGKMSNLVTEKAATPKQKRITEVDAGGMAFLASFGKQELPKLKPQPASKELVLTDLVAQAVAHNIPTHTVEVAPELGMGVNTMAQLLAAQAILSKRLVRKLEQAGVMFADPKSVAIYGKVTAQPDVFIDRNVQFGGEVRLAKGSAIGPNCVVIDSKLAAGARLHAFTHCEGATLANDAQAGPFARLRPGSKLGANAKVGNFVETKAAQLAPGSKANHLAYLGDCEVGADSNIGAGTVFCNYDGKDKHSTKVGKNAFVGSGSMLIAPVEVGEGALVAAGSVITTNVPANNLGIGRSRQQNLPKKRKKKIK